MLRHLLAAVLLQHHPLLQHPPAMAMMMIDPLGVSLADRTSATVRLLGHASTGAAGP
jgi:hypothetical protein